MTRVSHYSLVISSLPGMCIHLFN